MTQKRRDSNEPETEIEYIQAPMLKQKNITVDEDSEKGFALLKIYGTIGEPEEYVEELTKLEHLSNNYEVLKIILNSPGGSVSTTVDIISSIKNFGYIITIGKGEIASAAFMLWAMGNIRVVTKYSMYMAHRESYGMYGKTSEHRDTARTFSSVYDELFEECFGDLLTDEEKLIAERSESWISYKDLLKRPNVISFDEYMNPENPYSITELFITFKGDMFLYDKDNSIFRNVLLTYGDNMISDMTEYLYGICDVEPLPKELKPKKQKKNVKSSKDKKIKKE